MTSTYINGHHPSVLRSHTWRTAANSAAYLLPYLTSPSLTLLDVGCGPGTISLDFAALLPTGHVYGIDPSASVIEQAQASASERGITNITFLVGDVFELSTRFPDKQFDIVHAHQVLQHVTRPVDAIRAMASVLKSEGILASRETDFGVMAWWPLVPGLDEWRELWQKVARADGFDANTGRRLVSLALDAGFKREQINSTAGTWCYSTLEEREWWGGLWAERLLKSDFASKVVKRDFGTEKDLMDLSRAWEEWRVAPDGWFAMMHGEMVCRMGPDT